MLKIRFSEYKLGNFPQYGIQNQIEHFNLILSKYFKEFLREDNFLIQYRICVLLR